MIEKNYSVDEIRKILDKLAPVIINQPGLIKEAQEIALYTNNLIVAQLLIDYGADITADDESLLAAISSGNPEVVQFALKHGVDPTNDIREAIKTLADVAYNDRKIFRPIFELLTQNIDIHIDDDVIYKLLVSYEPQLLLELIQKEPNYTKVDKHLIEIIDEILGEPESLKTKELSALKSLKTYINEEESKY